MEQGIGFKVDRQVSANTDVFCLLKNVLSV